MDEVITMAMRANRTQMQALQLQLDAMRRRAKQAENRRADGVAFSFPRVYSRDLRYRRDGMRTYSLVFVPDARKPGEDAGRGTGIPLFYDPSRDRYFKMGGGNVWRV